MDFTDYVTYVGEVTKQRGREHRERVLLAYSQAMWTRIDSENLPKIDEILGDDPDAVDPEVIKSREQTPDEMAELLKSFAARSKGKSRTPRGR